MSKALKTIMKDDPDGVLKRFMQEFFHFPTLVKAGFFKKEMKGDYKAQAERVCKHFGYKTIYEYRATETKCHLSYEGKRPDNEPFVRVTPSIYD